MLVILISQVNILLISSVFSVPFYRAPFLQSGHAAFASLTLILSRLSASSTIDGPELMGSDQEGRKHQPIPKLKLTSYLQAKS